MVILLFLRQSVDYMIFNTLAELIRKCSRETLYGMVLKRDIPVDYPPHRLMMFESRLGEFHSLFFVCVLYAYTSRLSLASYDSI